MNSWYVFDTENPVQGSLEAIEHSLTVQQKGRNCGPGGGGRSYVDRCADMWPPPDTGQEGWELLWLGLPLFSILMYNLQYREVGRDFWLAPGQLVGTRTGGSVFRQCPLVASLCGWWP